MARFKKPTIFAMVRGQEIVIPHGKAYGPARIKSRAKRILKRKQAEEEYRKHQKRLEFRALAHQFIKWRENQ